MMTRLTIILGLFAGWMGTALAQETATIDSSYRNWYYDSREKLYQQLEGTRYDVVFLGNSITERGDWQELIGTRYAVANRGIGGDNTFGVLARLDGVIRIQPKKLFLMIGINDIGRGLPVDVILQNYRQIVSRIQSESPNTTLYLQAVLPLNESVLPYDYLKNKSEQIKALNSGIRGIAHEQGLTFVDLRGVLADEEVLKADFTSDGIHLKPQAYQHWVAYLKAKRFL
ncbi:GDSL-type esterase/lipase family protein [Parapedobacter deserti]|uniref:GDSL-type esterase/lipase family protein n=1 Tax=Parapedobacter deserti TaxID=1912957 RepID=A0ABV7JIK6_9SPHI